MHRTGGIPSVTLRVTAQLRFAPARPSVRTGVPLQARGAFSVLPPVPSSVGGRTESSAPTKIMRSFTANCRTTHPLRSPCGGVWSPRPTSRMPYPLRKWRSRYPPKAVYHPSTGRYIIHPKGGITSAAGGMKKETLAGLFFIFYSTTGRFLTTSAQRGQRSPLAATVGSTFQQRPHLQPAAGRTATASSLPCSTRT